MPAVRLNVGPMDNNTYVLFDEATGHAAVVDPSFGAADAVDAWLTSRAREAPDGPQPRVTLIIDTHAHLDHTVENAAVADRTGAELALHADDLPLLRAVVEQAEWFGIEPPPSVEPARLLADGDVVTVGALEVRVLHTPGHSPGGICLLGDGWVVTGDTLFADSVGRTDLPGGSMEALMASIRDRLVTLPPATRVCPGHGPETTIGRERKYNPFLTGL